MAKMAVLTQYHCGLAYFCLVCLTINFVLIEAQVLTADELLAQKEEELTEFVSAVEANANDCGTRIAFIFFFFVLIAALLYCKLCIVALFVMF